MGSAVTTRPARSRPSSPAAAGTGRSRWSWCPCRSGPGRHGWCGPSLPAGAPARFGGGRRGGSCRRPRPPAATPVAVAVGWSVAVASGGRWRWLLVGQPGADGQVQRVGVDAGQHATHGGFAWWPIDPAQRVTEDPERGEDRLGASAASSPIAARDLAPAQRGSDPTASTAPSACRRPRRVLGSAMLARSSSRLRHWSCASATGNSSRLAAVGMGDDVGAGTVFQRGHGPWHHMVTGVRGWLTFTPDLSSPIYPDNPAHCRGPGPQPLNARIAGVSPRLHRRTWRAHAFGSCRPA
jgi:hypothetical protein